MLDVLHARVMSTHHTAKQIGDELDDHHVLLDRLGTAVGHTTVELRSQQRSLGQLLKDTKHGRFYCIVAALVATIIVLLALASLK